MRCSKIFIASLLATIMAFTAPLAFGQDGAKQTKGHKIDKKVASSPEFQKNLEKWKSLTPEQQGKLKKLAAKLKEMPEGQRQDVVKKLKKLKSMPPEQRQKAVKAIKKLKDLPPEKREALKKGVAEAKKYVESLPEKDRAGFKALPLKQKADKVKKHMRERRLEDYLRQLSAEEREELQRMADQQAEELLK